MSNLNNVNFKMDYNKYTKEELVTWCNTYKSKIDYLESLKNNVALDSVVLCRNCKSENTYKCKITNVIVCKDCDYQD
mgnify:CR=1 FL=1